MSFLKSFFSGAKAKRAVIHPAEIAFDVASGETVLESALKKGISYPHDCTVGTCGSCRSRLLSGKVEAVTPFGYTLSKDELQAGYFLACQALAKSDLEIEVDISAAGVQEPIRQSATLIAVDDLTHDIKKVVWRVEQPMHWRAGQYLNVRWNGGESHRSYSFATAPARDGATELTTFMRHVPGGALTDQFFKGDPFSLSFEVDGPHGKFWLREGKGPFLCIAGGSGLAPILSLLQHAANHRIRRDCVLLFGARRERDLYCIAEIDAIRNAWTAGFDYWPILSEEQREGYRNGLVTAAIPAALEKLGPGVAAYLCGPPAMIDAAIDVLTHNGGVGLADIHYDKFTDASTKQ